MHITAIVTTFNRLSLLQECLAAIRQQSWPVTTILVVDNSSTDGTGQWLKTQSGIEVITQPNGGCSSALHTGIRWAYQTGTDWVWIMDDDTIPEPQALEHLLEARQITQANGDPFGYFVSKAVWSDGNIHLMNVPYPDNGFSGKRDLDWYRQQGIVPVSKATFVSLLISRDAIRKAGLPVREFFIWADDLEYTLRLFTNGFCGALVENSMVLHKTPVNYRSDIFLDTPAHIWKYRYGLRNELYIRRNYKGYGSFLRNVAKRFVLYPFLIMAKRKDARWAFIKVTWQSTWEALRFNPKPDGVNG